MIDEKIEFYYIEKGVYAPREDLPFVRRNNVAAIIRYQDEYLLLSWNEVNYEKTLVTGGINEQEEKKLAVIREVIEETGYDDFKKISEVDCINISKFFVEHKNENREAVYYPYLVELASLRRKNVDIEEEREHTCMWVNEQLLDEVKLFDNHRKMLEYARVLAKKF